MTQTAISFSVCREVSNKQWKPDSKWPPVLGSRRRPTIPHWLSDSCLRPDGGVGGWICGIPQIFILSPRGLFSLLPSTGSLRRIRTKPPTKLFRGLVRMRRRLSTGGAFQKLKNPPCFQLVGKVKCGSWIFYCVKWRNMLLSRGEGGFPIYGLYGDLNRVCFLPLWSGLKIRRRDHYSMFLSSLQFINQKDIWTTISASSNTFLEGLATAKHFESQPEPQTRDCQSWCLTSLMTQLAAEQGHRSFSSKSLGWTARRRWTRGSRSCRRPS